MAVSYARFAFTPAGLSVGATIFLDDYNRPLSLGIGRNKVDSVKSVIVVIQRDGDCRPSPVLIEDVYTLKQLWSMQNKTWTDVIVIGSNGFYSFAEEKVFTAE